MKYDLVEITSISKYLTQYGLDTKIDTIAALLALWQSNVITLPPLYHTS